MSNSTLWLGNISFLFIFLIGLASSMEFGAYPSEINSDLVLGKSSCFLINLFSSEDINNIKVSDLWNSFETKDINNFKENANDFEINIIYEKDLNFKKNKKFNFCVLPNKEGKYFGVILFEVYNSNVVLGVWTNFNVVSKLDSLETITGRSSYLNYSENSVFLQLIFSFILIVILIYMILKFKR